MLAGQVDSLIEHIGTLTSVRQVQTMMRFLEKFPDADQERPREACHEKLTELTTPRTWEEAVSAERYAGRILAEELMSPCHLAPLQLTLADGMLVGFCPRCGAFVVRINPVTGVEEYLKGASPWTREDLEPVRRI